MTINFKARFFVVMTTVLWSSLGVCYGDELRGFSVRNIGSPSTIAAFITRNQEDGKLPNYVPLNELTDSQLEEMRKVPIEVAMAQLDEVHNFSNDIRELKGNYRLVVARDFYRFIGLYNQTDGMGSVEESTPVIGFFMLSGEDGLPFLVEALADEGFSSYVKSNVLSAIISIKQINVQGQLPVVCSTFAEEYKLRAKRLRSLMEFLQKAPDSEVEALAQKSSPPIPVESVDQRVKRWSLSLVIIDNKSTEAQVLNAIAEAQKLKAFELAPDLCDKLDPTPPPKVQNVLAANPKGRLSPAIAEASEAALRAMGRDALPALLDAVSMAGRGSAYRAKAMSLILAAAGSNEAAREALESAAKQNDERAARLRRIVEGDNKAQK